MGERNRPAEGAAPAERTAGLRLTADERRRRRAARAAEERDWAARSGEVTVRKIGDEK